MPQPLSPLTGRDHSHCLGRSAPTFPPSVSSREEPMSRATELARAEAEAAEAETPDELETEHDEEAEEAETEHDAPPEPEPEPVTEATLRAIGQKIAAEDTRHEKRLREILGDLWGERQPCPLCLQEGFIVAANPGEFDPGQREAVLLAMGESGPSLSATHPTLIRCDVCDGWGKLYTGSRDPAYEFDACVKCGGTGRMDRIVAERPTQTLAAVPKYPWDEQAEPVVAPNADRWGRPMNHPDFGLDPIGIVATVRG